MGGGGNFGLRISDFGFQIEERKRRGYDRRWTPICADGERSDHRGHRGTQRKSKWPVAGGQWLIANCHLLTAVLRANTARHRGRALPKSEPGGDAASAPPNTVWGWHRHRGAFGGGIGMGGVGLAYTPKHEAAWGCHKKTLGGGTKRAFGGGTRSAFVGVYRRSWFPRS
jgi:hypothetical protein